LIREAFSTHEIFDQYRSIPILNSDQHLEYRRVFDLLEDLENLGVIISKKISQGRFGYHKFYHLSVYRDIVGRLVSPGDWDVQVADMLNIKRRMEKRIEEAKMNLKLKRNKKNRMA